MFVLVVSSSTRVEVSGLGSMSSIAVSYGPDGPVFCGLKADGSHSVSCYGSDASVVYGAPSRVPLLGLTAGSGFVCGLLLDSNQPYCWGSNPYVKMGVPQPMIEGAAYSEISAGDHHLCALRKTQVLIDCWGYNMTASYQHNAAISMITAGSVFSCGLFLRNKTTFCWGDETGSGVIGLIPRNIRFHSISAGGFHVCGILENFQVFCWGRSSGLQQSVNLAPMDPMVAVSGGRFHACGIKSFNHEVLCWGFTAGDSVPPPKQAKFYEITAGDYFTCGVLAERSLRAVCWGSAGPWSAPLAVSPGVCSTNPCGPGYYEYSILSNSNSVSKLCKSIDSRVCLPCSVSCPQGTLESSPCNSSSDLKCEFNCSTCNSTQCSSFCSSKTKHKSLLSIQLPIFLAELVFTVILLLSVTLAALFYVRYKLRNCTCNATTSTTNMRSRAKRTTTTSSCPSSNKDSVKIMPDLRRAQVFTYEELEKATGKFKEESIVGKGSFSCVFKGVLKDGTVVAVKRAIMAASPSPEQPKRNSKEFKTELDLLSRLNHAHLLNLLGYCEEEGERLLVYEFMAHGSLYQHLHGKDPLLKKKLDWVRRVTIAVQAARGIEYLHGYACPPVIHRDIKSSNILIDEEHNARVSDFGLSLLGPTDSSAALSELPAGTLGYLDPEYYRLHYLTTKSDVYSFGVLLLEILSGRKAIDMRYEEGNIVEWAVPLIKCGEIEKVLDPVLKKPGEMEGLRRIARVACKCVRMRGKERPAMEKVTTELERGLAMLMGSPREEEAVLATEVVLGSSRMNNNSSNNNNNNSGSSGGSNNRKSGRMMEEMMEGMRAPSWITFPSVTSSQRRPSGSEVEVEVEMEGRRRVVVEEEEEEEEEEIGPASPQEELFLQHNF
ncbi:Non-specific serine/threonine protein kinase protein [Dioscorea alata]|uniref:Non-specific serine/threonine protein kinase protein n=1 Tax=Dioscorea alata TaxID=55571 RepID=A0ACB7W0U1_DIOAL|nr:Non-specific serine/threonine protein kinase protein [Dioscorea alata]